MKYYITSSSVSFDGYTNLRQGASINTPTVGKISTLGLIVDKLSESGNWTQYNDGIKSFWLRNDVHKSSIFSPRILDVPHVYQHDPNIANLSRNDCGQSSLSILLKYYGLEKTPNEITVELGANNDRFTNFAELLNYSKKNGFTPTYMRPMHLPDIMKNINEGRPTICLINYDQLYSGKRYGHFLVVVGYDEKYIYVQNPDINQVNITHSYVRFNKAIGQDGTTDNMAFQGMYFLDNMPSAVVTCDDILKAISELKELLEKYLELES